MTGKKTYADVILPLSLEQYFTYSVPEALINNISTGMRVVVQFGPKRLYSAIVRRIHTDKPSYEDIKEIISVLDEIPVVNNFQFDLWEWIATYYMCTTGDIMNAAIPAGLKLESETNIYYNESFRSDALLSEQEQKVLFVIEKVSEISVSKLSVICGIKNMIPLIKSLVDKGAIFPQEKIKESFKPKSEIFIRLHSKYVAVDSLHPLLEDLSMASKQKETLKSYLKLSGYNETSEIKEVHKSLLLESTGIKEASLRAMIKKEIFEISIKEMSRLSSFEGDTANPALLNPLQEKALEEIKSGFKKREVILLHGITSSGKTEIYFHLIKDVLNQNKQVLYLVPEIALTSQMIHRMQSVFGTQVGVYHSKYNLSERVEIWNNLIKDENSGYKIILGVRSAIFLPFSKLGLIIIDEEHENSYKQFDPAPRYHARDTAIMLARLHGAKTILGTATPSVESYYNAKSGKYGLVNLSGRFNNMELPEIKIADVRHEQKKKSMKSHFTPLLLTSIENMLNHNKQIILFQNRRGFSSFIQCNECGWIPHCNQCDVSLTYHKHIHRLVCHYCGYTTKVATYCNDCKSENIMTKGFGTEKIEEDITIFFPHARMARLDIDTAKTRKSYETIIQNFEKHDTDILIGTQMISKGLDFNNVGLVGIINADSMLNFPDYRSFERSFQLMCQVSGRAGRKGERGLVIIQTYNPKHPIIKNILDNDYEGMAHVQLVERKQFNYPPYCRLIRLTLKHRDKDICEKASKDMAMRLRKIYHDGILGPDIPLINRIQNLYLKNILIKIKKEDQPEYYKKLIKKEIDFFLQEKDYKTLHISADVDPM